MSIKIMAHVWEHKGITATQKLVLLALADWCNDDGLCWPSIARIADKCSLTPRAVQMAIRAMQEIGLIHDEEVVGKGKKYWITIPMNNLHPCTTFTPPLHDMHPTPAPRSPNTSIIHQLTTKDEAPSSDDAPVSVQEIIDYWNTFAGKHGLAKVKMLNAARQKQLKARIREFPDIETWSEAFRNIERSPFLLGENNRCWRANFDFLIQPSSFIKLIEGTYNGQ